MLPTAVLSLHSHSEGEAFTDRSEIPVEVVAKFRGDPWQGVTYRVKHPGRNREGKVADKNMPLKYFFFLNTSGAPSFQWK